MQSISKCYGYLDFEALSVEKQQHVTELLQHFGLKGQIIDNTMIGLEAQDWNADIDLCKKIGIFLFNLAPIVVSASGEIECCTFKQEEWNFNFYSIQGGKLYGQQAHLLKSTRIEITEPNPTTSELLAYMGLFHIEKDLGKETTEAAKTCVEKTPIRFINDKTIKVQYTGRDSQRWLVRLLFKLAEITGDVDGEVKCEINIEGADPDNELYRIGDGKLYMQKGRMLRGETVEVTNPES